MDPPTIIKRKYFPWPKVRVLWCNRVSSFTTYRAYRIYGSFHRDSFHVEGEQVRVQYARTRARDDKNVRWLFNNGGTMRVPNDLFCRLRVRQIIRVLFNRLTNGTYLANVMENNSDRPILVFYVHIFRVTTNNANHFLGVMALIRVIICLRSMVPSHALRRLP